MYDETKEALRTAFKISKTLFGLGKIKYSKLLAATNAVNIPSKKDLEIYILNGIPLEVAIPTELKKRYIAAAKKAGFEAKHGIAMLKYTAMLKEIEDEKRPKII